MRKIKPEWEEVTFEMPINAHLCEKDDIDVIGAPWICVGARKGEGDDRDSLVEPYVAFYSGDDGDSYRFQRPLAEILEGAEEDGAAEELISELLLVIKKWRLKNFGKWSAD